MTLALPASILYGKITGQFLQAVIDVPDDPDENPNAVPITGTVTFKPSAESITDAQDKAIILPAPIKVTLVDGRIVSPDGTDGIVLVATDSPWLNPLNFTWNVSFAFDSVSLAGFNFSLPSGSVKDLSEVIPVASSPGTLTTQGPKGDTGFFSGAEDVVDIAAATGNIDLDLSLASAFNITLTGNTVLTFINAQADKVSSAILRITQGGAGGYTLTIAGQQASFGANPLENLSTNVGAVDKVACESWDDGAHWDVAIVAQQIA